MPDGLQRGGRSGVPVYTPEIEDEILERLAAGEGLIAICRSRAEMPTDTTVRRWAMEDHPPGFALRYARAKQLGFERLAEEVIEIGDADYRLEDGTTDNAAVQQARLRSDNRKWLLSKVLPKIYGDRVTAEVVGDPDRPIVTRIELVAVDPNPAPLTIENDGSGSPAVARLDSPDANTLK